MKNLNVSTEIPEDFYDLVVNSKRYSAKDPNYKDRLALYKPNIGNHFVDYNNRYINDTLGAIVPVGYPDQTKDDLLKLYRYKDSIFQKLKKEVTTTTTNRVINTCQNCTINSVNSLDHIIPKEELSEFSVHPKNLFPSCIECNSKKNAFWRNENQLLFLNLYLHSLPDLIYLFVTVNFVNGFPEINFSISNPNGIDPVLFSIIETHYSRLDLISRFKLNLNEVITNLENQILANKDRLARQELLDSIVEHHNLNRAAFGYNHWKSLLSIEVTNCQPYMDSLFI
ncbi:HNH endonuclease [uncultured Nonlabens sp.]|uniref:HNH endonuclease n=1 Tax=uncultured Nonlabens sp. TaxID=859306 RepID=UPI0030DA94C3|tara:strand:- start:12698 stop:13546 length:849 start_codon:yes stop_codon:yes gene_type:complete